MTTTSTCRAKNPEACRYHGAVKRIEEAIRTGDVGAYLAAKQEAVAAKTVYDNSLLAWLGTEKKQREQELSALVAPTQVEARAANGQKIEATKVTVITRPSDYQNQWDDDTASDEWLMVVPTAEVSSYECSDCGTFYLNEDMKTYDGDTSYCSCCKTRTSFMGVNLTPESLKLLRDPEQVKQQSWYHISTNPSWEEVLNDEDAVVHLGSRFAAWMRGQAITKPNFPGKTPEKLYLYEVTLGTQSVVGEDSYSDSDLEGTDKDSHWPSQKSRSDLFSDIDLGQVHRYVNYWEDPGSISVFTKPNNISSVKLVAENPSP